MPSPSIFCHVILFSPDPNLARFFLVISLLVVKLPPPIPALPLVPITILAAMQIYPTARHAIGGAQPDGGAAHDAADAQLCAQGLAPAEGEQGVEAGPCGGEARAGGWVAGEVEVGGEEQRWGEEGEGEGLEGAGVEGGDEGCEEGGGEGGCLVLLAVGE